MKKIFTLFIILMFIPLHWSNAEENSLSNYIQDVSYSLYTEMQLENIIDFTVFKNAITGYYQLDVDNKDIITLIDFSKPSTEKRFYVLDLKQKKLLFESHVSHGKNSGGNYATSFSNKNGSNKSSLGFFVTQNTYQGKHGYSLIIDGLEEGINDKAKERAIVIHSASYANPSVIPSSGRLGRSFGCPALPESVSTPIINTIKDGSLLYIYANDQEYFDNSNLFQ